MQSRDIKRREFLKGAATAVAVLPIVAVLPTEANSVPKTIGQMQIKYPLPTIVVEQERRRHFGDSPYEHLAEAQMRSGNG